MLGLGELKDQYSLINLALFIEAKACGYFLRVKLYSYLRYASIHPETGSWSYPIRSKLDRNEDFTLQEVMVVKRIVYSSFENFIPFLRR